jgi:hypothetical protein
LDSVAAAFGGLALTSTSLPYSDTFSFSSFAATSYQCLASFSASLASFLDSSIYCCNASSFFLYFFSASQFSKASELPPSPYLSLDEAAVGLDKVLPPICFIFKAS